MENEEITIDGKPIEFDPSKKENPGYYANIPSEVRYCKITMGARFMYGEITALSNKEGYCWASNKYFADLYNVSNRTISSWIGELKEKNFIRYEVEENYRRKIFITMHFLGDTSQSS